MQNRPKGDGTACVPDSPGESRTCDGNPHVHLLVTMRPFNPDHTWGSKEMKDWAFVRGLKWNAINYENRELTIRHTVTGNRTIYAEDKTKSKSGHRTLNLFPTAELCFKKLKQQQEENREFFGDTYCDTQGYVFTHEDGHPYRPDFISKKFVRAMTEFGRPEITLHKLRYTCASLLIDKGWDVKKVQYCSGTVMQLQ